MYIFLDNQQFVQYKNKNSPWGACNKKCLIEGEVPGLQVRSRSTFTKSSNSTRTNIEYQNCNLKPCFENEASKIKCKLENCRNNVGEKGPRPDRIEEPKRINIEISDKQASFT